MRALRRRRLRVLLGLAALCALGLLGAVAWLLRDPVPRWRERGSRLVAVEEGPALVAGGAAYQPARLRAASGLEVDVLVRPPPAAEPKARRPLYLLVGGYRTGERAATLVGDAPGAIVAALGYPYDGPTDVRGLAVLPRLPAIRRAVLDTPPAIRLALDWLLARPDVDPTRVELVGVSFGAFFAPAAAALDSRVTRLWIVHGAARPREVLERGLEPWIGWGPARALVAAAADVVLGGPALAPERWVPRVAPRPVVMINALDDARLPRSAVEALHASAHEPSEVVWVDGGHVHPERPDLIAALMDVVLERAGEPRGQLER
ncbi:MAG TPA: hypothetical protein VFQ22_07875 [Longimicrobiales bacterium]|nr:hypothetical protein [Longimicrobiales bacterium]